MSRGILTLVTAAAVVVMLVFGCGTDAVDGASPDAGAAVDGASPGLQEFVIGGTVTGLLGTGMVLQNNGSDDITANANGVFVFPTKVASGSPFSVTVKAHPTAPTQVCTVSGAAGVVGAANVTSVVVNCSTVARTLSGTVSGLAGTGLTLQNNAGDDLTIGANGAFAFAKTLEEGADYAVTIRTQPKNLAQTCSVTNGSGKMGPADITNVTVECVTNQFTVGGTVAGLSGSGLVLQNNGGGDLAIAANGAFTFAAAQNDGSSFAVTTKTHPTNPKQTCTVSGAAGTLAGGNVESINVSCSTNTFAVGGTVTGLAGSGLVLQNNAGNDLSIAANGTFAFGTPIADLASYAVTVKAQPTNKWQTCTVSNGAGNVAAAAVTTVAVACTTNRYTIGGNVSGLAPGNSVVIQNNAADDWTVAADGTFTFPTAIESGQAYVVTVKTHPTTPNQTCTVTGGTGAVAAGNIVSVNINCSSNKYTAGGSVAGLEGTGLVLQNNGGGDLAINGNGSFAFTPQLDESSYAITVKTQPTAKSQTCTVTNGAGAIAGGNVATVSVGCTTNKYTVGGSVTGLGSGTVVLQNNGGDDKSLNADGSFAFSAPIASGNAYAVAVKEHPVGMYCAVTNGSGTVTNGAIDNVNVKCSNVTLVAKVAGVSFYAVFVPGSMTDPNVYAACAGVGLMAPCQGPPGCRYQNNQCKLISDADSECGSPGLNLAWQLCGSGVSPKACPALHGMYYYLGETWVGGSCGIEATDWCAEGKTQSNKLALCVEP